MFAPACWRIRALAQSAETCVSSCIQRWGSTLFRRMIAMKLTRLWLSLSLLCSVGAELLRAAEYDVVVYGSTSGGVIAAVQAKKLGKTVVLVSPDKHLGGLSSGGLGFTDTGNKAVIGGLSREFYHRVWKHYDQADAWKWQKREEFGNKGQGTPAIDGERRTMWVFEPHVAENIFEDFVRENQIPVHRDEWLDREKGVKKSGARIASITTLAGNTYAGRMFIDATYEGDLMAAAGVSYHVGREATSTYGEQWNGVQTGVLHHRHHFGGLPMGISPYVVPGDPKSGVLPRISTAPPGEKGQGDKLVQAYCYRMCLSDHPENRIPFAKPEGYDPKHYELLARIYAAGWRETFDKYDPIPNHKTDTNNHGPMSTDNIGYNYDYPDASYARRREILREHETYQKGWLYFVATDPRVPEDVRTAMQTWGLPKDEFVDNGGWPHQIYVREARRMVGAYVMTENELLKKRPTPDSVGMGSYGIDSHNIQRYITPEGYVQNEGDIGVSTKGPYEIAYGSIVPKPGEADNLLVSVCVSSSHIAFGSIRMEPVFMILGQSAATAAAMAIDGGIPVQQVSYSKLRERLLADGQILKYTPPPTADVPKKATSMLLLETDFRATAYGRIPLGWRDLVNRRPSRNWAVDGKALLRPMLKDQTGLLVYEGYLLNSKPSRLLDDYSVTAEFQKTEDEQVSFGLAGRVHDRDNYYLARLVGDSRLELVKVSAGKSDVLASLVTAHRYREGDRWRLSLAMAGDVLTSRLHDSAGREQARLDAQDTAFAKGSPGLCATTFAAAASLRIDSVGEPQELRYVSEQIERRNSRLRAASADAGPDYPVARPYWNHAELDTPPTQLVPEYDVVVAGAGTGGWAAAVQAARLGARVLLLEPSDWIGGQMCAAGVTTMDEDSVWMKFPVRERGLYREFHESMAAYYYTLDKDPFVAYYGVPRQMEGGYEPKAARAVLYGFIAEARSRLLPSGGRPVLDVSLSSEVTAVHKQGDTLKGEAATGETVTGVTVALNAGPQPLSKRVACKVLIDATEYGDVIPLTGARYRVGNVTSQRLDPAALVQDHTWTAIVREYPASVPEHLKIQSPPPGYDENVAKRFRKFQLHGLHLWGSAGKGIKGPRDWRVYFAWRGMADTDSPLIGERSSLRHTRCGFNGGNDYPVSVATCQDPAQRRRDEREGIYRTLGALYYFQHELGLNWSLAEDEGYNTPYNRRHMQGLELRPDLAALAVHLPQMPYVREARRVIGVQTLVAADLTRYDDAKHVATSVAMGDYFMDLDHGHTAHALEADLDTDLPPKGGGPFQIPFEVFLPEKLDGFLPAEKNISQSRLANGATRLQPVTMLTGQAAGTIAALAVKQGVPPRRLDVKHVQAILLESGCTLIQRWYSDVPWGTPIWRATQLLALHRVMDRPGTIDKDNAVPLAATAQWGVSQPLAAGELEAAVARLAELTHVRRLTSTSPVGGGATAVDLAATLDAFAPSWGQVARSRRQANPDQVTAGEFAMIANEILLQPSTSQR